MDLKPLQPMQPNTNLKPIETNIFGCSFRSRTEARWAVFFHNMGLDWSYEPQRFLMPSGVEYTPDFLIKHADNSYENWYEIKPKGSFICPKVIEFSKSLNNTYQTISQLNGDPVDYICSICPVCKQTKGKFEQSVVFDPNMEWHDLWINALKSRQERFDGKTN